MLLIPVFTYRLRDMRLYAPLRNDFFSVHDAIYNFFALILNESANFHHVAW